MRKFCESGWIVVILLLTSLLYSQSKATSDLLDRFVDAGGPIPRNHEITFQLLESPEDLEAEIIERMRFSPSLQELYFYGVLANLSENIELRYHVWKAAAEASLGPDAESWTSAESVVEFLPVSRMTDIQFLRRLAKREYSAGPKLSSDVERRIQVLEQGSAEPQTPRPGSNQRNEVVAVIERDDEEPSGLRAWVFGIITVAASGAFIMFIRRTFGRQS